MIDKGHKRIGYIGSIKMTSSAFERWTGYNKAMLEAGYEIDKKLCLLESLPLGKLLGDNDELDIYIKSLKELPTAWFCANDRVAISLIQALARVNIKVPDDVSVAGFDDIEPARMIYPPLTTVRVRRDAIGRKAVDFLLDIIQKGSDESVKVLLYGELVVKESVNGL